MLLLVGRRQPQRGALHPSPWEGHGSGCADGRCGSFTLEHISATLSMVLLVVLQLKAKVDEVVSRLEVGMNRAPCLKPAKPPTPPSATPAQGPASLAPAWGVCSMQVWCPAMHAWVHG